MKCPFIKTGLRPTHFPFILYLLLLLSVPVVNTEVLVNLFAPDIIQTYKGETNIYIYK